ncbi:MAG: VPLPA-CTERM sorting domain-containing protein [Pseudomonadota bacterium]
MLRFFMAACAALFVASSATATTLSANLQGDNEYTIYMSTDDGTAGTEFGSGINWSIMGSHAIALTPGVTNYLHVYVYDVGPPLAGLLGEFTLSSTDFEFANGSQTLLTGDSALRVSQTGWENYVATNNVAPHGGHLWGWRADDEISDDAFWVWNGGSASGAENFFSAEIAYVGDTQLLPDSPAAVPLPASVLLLGGGLGALVVARRRRRAV